MKKLFSILTAAAVMASMAAVPASAAAYGTLTMDTQSYIMAPGDIYDFRAKVEGGDLRQEEVVVSDSRTGSVVQLSRVPGTDKYRIKAVNEGVCWVVAEVRGTHASIRVEVKKGAVQCGVATRSITQVPISSSSADNNNTSSESDGSSGGSATVIDITPEGANEGGGFTVDVRYPEGTPVIDADTEDEDVPEGINEEYAEEIFKYTNEERENAGLEPLEWNDNLTEAAQIRAEELTVKFSHERPNGEWAMEEWYFEGAHGEICTTASSPQNAVELWMESSEHRRIMLDEDLKSVAVGCYVNQYGKLYCVELLSGNEV